MKVSITFIDQAKNLSMLLGAVFLAVELQAQPLQGKVEVRGLMGSVLYSAPGGQEMPVRVKSAVPVGAMIKTAQGGAVDLSFGQNAGVVRLLQNSRLMLERFNVLDSSAGAPVDLQLNLLEGTILGFDQKVSSGSKYRVKVTDGIAEVSGTKYRINAQGYLVVLQGNALFAFVPSNGEPVPYELHGASPVYFSPTEGIRSAPGELVREVVLQTKGQLKGK